MLTLGPVELRAVLEFYGPRIAFLGELTCAKIDAGCF
jgi:hypothetical protein